MPAFARSLPFLILMLVFAWPGAGTAGDVNLLFSRPGHYNYVPSTIQTGNTLRIWWCGGDYAGSTDNIFYREIDTATQVHGPIVSVLKPSPGTWDSAFVCDPSVVQGEWQIPPGSGKRYTLAMYYTGTDDARCQGINNGMGVAFSNDGIRWVKYPYAIFRNPRQDPPACTSATYGVGEQSVISADGKSALWLFVLQAPVPGRTGQNYGLYYSPDGLHLEHKFLISTAGVDAGFITEADFAFDRRTRDVYMVTDRVNTEDAVDIYRIKFEDLQSGRWTRIGSVTKATTGNPRNQGAGFLRDAFGSNTAFLPRVQVFFGSGQLRAVDTNSWQLWWHAFQAPPP